MSEEVPENRQELSLVCRDDILFSDPGDDVVLSCHLVPSISAASMEIKWWNKDNLLCHYKDGQVTVSSEGQVSFSWQDLHNGIVSLTLRDVRIIQKGQYICEVIHESQAMKEYIFLRISSDDISLVVPDGIVSADPGSDVILPVHLSPETSAVSMTVRWFRGTELIYQYKNRQEKTNNENQVSLSIQELEKGNLSLTLRNVEQSDSGKYTCKVFHDGCQETGVIHLQVREPQKRKHTSEYQILPDSQRQTQTDETTFQETLDLGVKDAKKRKYNAEERVLENLINNLESQDVFSHFFGLTPRRGNDGDHLLITDEFLPERPMYNEPAILESDNFTLDDLFLPSDFGDSGEEVNFGTMINVAQENSTATRTPEQEIVYTDQARFSRPVEMPHFLNPFSSVHREWGLLDLQHVKSSTSPEIHEKSDDFTLETPNSFDFGDSGASCESFDTELRDLESLLSDEQENPGATRTQEQESESTEQERSSSAVQSQSPLG